MGLNIDYSSLWNRASSAVQENLPDFNLVNQWKDFDFSCPEVIKNLVSNENCATIVSVLKATGYLTPEQVKLINVCADIYNNAEWKNWDLTDTNAIKKLAANPDYDLILAGMQTLGYAAPFQISGIRSKIQSMQKVSQTMLAFKKDLEGLQNVSKLEVFRLGERKVNADNANSRWNFIASLGCAALGGVVGTASALWGLSGCDYIGAGLSALTSGMSFGVVYSQKDKIYKHVENCMIEGYYLKTKEIVEKHFKENFGDKAVELILSNVNAKGQLDGLGNKGFRRLVDYYMNA